MRLNSSKCYIRISRLGSARMQVSHNILTIHPSHIIALPRQMFIVPNRNVRFLSSLASNLVCQPGCLEHFRIPRPAVV